MRSPEERITEVKRRIAKKERQKRLQQYRIAAAFAVAACLVVIVSVSLSRLEYLLSSCHQAPGILNRIEPGTSFGYETAATILGGNAALGYIVIGLLAFILGVCVTILCFRIRLMNKEKETEEQKGDDADGTGQ